MSESDSSMSMNSLMEAIYGTHQSEYCPQFQDYSIDYIPQFMQSLINHLIELCVTQKSAENIEMTLNPWIKHSQQNERNPKASIEGFLYEFLKLYDQQTQKINKYGQKKLKYLTNTVSKQIFTQIMRMSCDLKFQSINRMNHVRSMQRKANNTSIFVFSLDKLFQKDKLDAFKLIKTSFLQSIQKQQLFITKVTSSISKVDRLCFQAKKMKLWKTISLWRLRNIEASKQQICSINNQIKSFFNTTLPGVVKAWQSKPLSWVVVIIENLKQLFKCSLGYSEGIEIEFMGNPNMEDNSLDYSALSSQRSSISSMSCIEIGEFMKNEQIKYDNNKRYLIIPIIADQEIGIVKISWQYQLPLIVFNRIVKIAEATKLIIKKFAKIGNRIGYYSSEYQNNAWHQQLFNLAIKQQPLTMKAFQQILQSAKITFLEIFHDRNSPKPCIKYGKENVSLIPENIYKLIWLKLEKQSQFDMERQKTKISILKLQDQEGFCRYSFEDRESQNYTENESKKSIAVKCIVPLIAKNLGSIGCKSCKIKVTELIPQIDSGLISKSSRNTLINTFNHQTLMKIKDIKNVNDLEDCFEMFLTQALPQFHLYGKILYLVSQTKNLYAHQVKKNTSIVTQLIEVPKVITNENICHIETMSMEKNFARVVELMYTNPLFVDSEIYQYQNEKKHPLRLFPKRIGRKALILVSTFDPLFEIQEILSIFSTQVDQNNKIFMKVDLYNWASSLFYENPSGSSIEQTILPEDNIQLQKSLPKGEFAEELANVYKNLPNVVKYFTWKLNFHSKIVVNIVGSNGKYRNQDSTVNDLWEKLAKEAVLSHQNIKSSHRILQLSKYYGQKLQSFLTYVPSFATLKEKIQYAEVVCQKSEDVGEYANVLYDQVSEFLNSTQKLEKDQYQFVSVPIHFENSIYITILIYNKSKHIHSECFRGLQNYIRNKTLDILKRKKKQSQTNILMVLNKNCDLKHGGLLLKGNRLRVTRQVVTKFKANFSMKKERNLKMFRILSRIYKLVHFRAYRKGFAEIKLFQQNKRVMQANGAKILMMKATKIFGLKILVERLEKIEQMKNGLKKLQSCFFRLTLKTSCKVRVSKQQFFNILVENKLQRQKQKQLNQKYFVQKVCQIWDNTQRRNSIQFFNKAIYNFYSLKKSLEILKDEFELIGPRSMKSCTDFLTSRLSLMLKEHYLIPLTVQITSSFNCPFNSSTQFITDDFTLIDNTSFVVSINSQAANISKSTCLKLIEPVLSKILPKWESNFRKYERIKTKRAVELIQRLIRKNLSFLFMNHRSELNKQNISLFNRLKSTTTLEVEKMRQLQQSFNPQKNLQSRQTHKKQMEQLKGQINALQNYQYKVDLETRIKRKTNATYQMINMLNKFTGNELVKEIAQATNKKKDVEGSCEQDKFRYVCQVLPVWISKLSRILKEKKKEKKKEFIQILTTRY